MSGLIIGILVGGIGRRMGPGYVAKGMLPLPGGRETVVERLLRVTAGLGTVVLVGKADSYAGIGCEVVADERVAGRDVSSPLSGLVALLARAGASPSLALACDLPYVTRDLVLRLAGYPSTAPVVAPRHDATWDPLFARYDSPCVLGPARARLAGPWLSLQRLLDEVGAEELPLDPRERAMLRDWDRPEDVS